jgi:hypothetical protein
MTGDVMKMTMKQMRVGRVLMTGVLAAVLMACGGGGGNSGTSKYSDPTPSVTAPVAVSDLRMTLSNSSVTNVTTEPVTATVTAVGDRGQVLAGVSVNYAVTGGATYSRTSLVTDTNGKNAASVDISSSKANRTVTVTATAGSKTVSKTFEVNGTKIDATPTPALLDASVPAKVTFLVTDANGSPQASVPITVSYNGGTTQATTDPSGLYEFGYTAPATAGATAVITATSAGLPKTVSVPVKAANQVIQPVSLSGVSPSLQVNKTVVPVNAAGSTANRIQAVVTFKTTAGVPVPNARVVYRLSGFVAVGGQFLSGTTSNLTTGTAVAYSGADGRSVDYYIPGLIASSNNQVLIQACYGPDDATAQACTTKLEQAITVAAEAVSVTIGTDNLIEDQKASLSYAQRYVVQVTNSAGQPKAGVEVSPVINTVDFRKGYFERVSSKWVPASVFDCPKEDLNDNDTKDLGEDLNHNTRLEPVRANITFTPDDGATYTTNSEGKVIFKMSYPKDKAYWNQVKIEVSALVSGSEGRAFRYERLGYLASDANAEGAPAFVQSEYGIETSNVTLTSERVMLDGTRISAGTTLKPCQNPD